MENVNIELCPETGICSIISAGGSKTDLMPDEVKALRMSGSDLAKVRQIVAGADEAFALALSETELRQIAGSIG